MIRCILIMSMCAIAIRISAQQRIPELKRSVNRLLQSHVDSGNISGAVVSIRLNGNLIHQDAYGYASKKQRDGSQMNIPEKMSTGHLFDIASLTKVVGTTTGIMLLVDRGKIRVDDPVGKYISGFGSAEKKDITIRHLLTHTSGLYEWYPLYYRARGREEVYRLIASLPLQFPIGQQRKYSDLGFTILGQLIEVVSGRKLEAFLKEEVFEPLGMHQTMYNPLESKRPLSFAATSFGNPYEYRMVHDTSLGFHYSEINPESWNGWRGYVLKGEVNDGNAWYAGQGVSGAAGLFSTAGDLDKLVGMLLNNGKISDRNFVSEKTVRQFLTMDTFHHGLGWMMDQSGSFMKNAPAGSFGHTGFTGTSIVAVPGKKLSIILLINRQHVGLLESKEYYNVNPIRRELFSMVMKAVD